MAKLVPQPRLALRGYRSDLPTDRSAQDFRPGDRIDHGGLVGEIIHSATTGCDGQILVELIVLDADGIEHLLNVGGSDQIGRPPGNW